MKFCPQCGTPFEPGGRFCMECGFDKSKVKLVDTPEISIQDTVINPSVESTEEKESTDAKPASIPVFTPVDLPEIKYNPVTELVESEVKIIPPAEPPGNIIPESAEPDKVLAPKLISSDAKNRSEIKQGRKNTGRRWIFIFFILSAFVAVGWYVLNSFSNSEKKTDTFQNMELPPITEVDTTKSEATVQEQTPEKQPEQAKSASKPVSKIDQELERQKTKEKNKTAQKAVAPVQKTNQDLIDKALAKSAENEKQTKVIFEVGKNEEAKSKSPKKPTKLVIRKTAMIVRITTDHYNNGMGTKGGGTISIKDESGNIVGTYRAYDKSGINGTPNAKWIAEPHKILEKGTYYILDSDMSTWSKSFWGTGFVVVEGYDVE